MKYEEEILKRTQDAKTNVNHDLSVENKAQSALGSISLIEDDFA
jgi:hypothetical protein